MEHELFGRGLHETRRPLPGCWLGPSGTGAGQPRGNCPFHCQPEAQRGPPAAVTTNVAGKMRKVRGSIDAGLCRIFLFSCPTLVVLMFDRPRFKHSGIFEILLLISSAVFHKCRGYGGYRLGHTSRYSICFRPISPIFQMSYFKVKNIFKIFNMGHTMIE